MVPRNDENSVSTGVLSAFDISQHKGDAVEGLSKTHEATISLSNPNSKEAKTERDTSISDMVLQKLIETMAQLQLGTYQREHVSNLTTNTSNTPSNLGRRLFDTGLRLMMSYQHELAALYFQACAKVNPHVALAHGLIALCHGPNYNFKGEIYYTTANHDNDVHLPDMQCVFPSQQVADRHSAAAMAIIEEIQQQQNNGVCENNHQSSNGDVAQRTTYTICNIIQLNEKGKKNQTIAAKEFISDVEGQFLSAVRLLTGTPGVDPKFSDELVGRPYANAMRNVYRKYPDDPEMAYFFAESLMVLNAWKLYKYPSGVALSPDVDEIREVLERALPINPHHPGLLHLYIHLCEMSSQPERALSICDPLRTLFPHAGHLLHMPTHIDVLLGRYDSCIRSNLDAIQADLFTMQMSPATAGRESAYFGYILHNFHMAVYGSILGGMEQIGMEIAKKLNTLVNEFLFTEHPKLVPNLEKYSAMDIHVMVRFGRWKELLEIDMPIDEDLMIYRTASILYGKALALAMKGDITEATKIADQYDALRKKYPEAPQRNLRNNSVADVLAVDAVMMRGEIAYKAGQYTEGLVCLQKAVEMQDSLNFEEPWGKMQPIRHALGGLLREQGMVGEAEAVFRKDLELHPRNPWALTGLIQCMEQTKGSGCCCCDTDEKDETRSEIFALKEQFRIQRQMEWADYDIVVACECCTHSQ